LNVLERSAGNRKSAAIQFGIDEDVLRKIGDLTANKGGKEARKFGGVHADFTPAERIWLQEVLKMVVRRAAEVEFDPKAARKKITMSSLPTI
jgi:hypothetical protein